MKEHWAGSASVYCVKPWVINYGYTQPKAAIEASDWCNKADTTGGSD